MKKFSIIIATYSGLKTIAKTFNSLLAQQPSRTKYEVIVVIDGPNESIRQTVEKNRMKFTEQGINFKVEQLGNNQGRFEARLVGAKLARYDQLFFLDDRVYLPDNYFKILQTIRANLAISNVSEVFSGERSNIISTSLHYVRRGIYGEKWGNQFNDYYIDSKNFEDSPKGTASLWINKSLFVKICERIRTGKSSGTKKYVNEDTRILREVVDKGHNILRTSKLSIYYKPRDDLKQAIVHLYNRGPRFVDYYMRPGTKFFPLLLSIYLFLLLLILAAALKPMLLWYLLALLIGSVLLAAIVLGKDVMGAVKLATGLPLVLLIFSAGVIKGTLFRLGSLFRAGQ